MHPIQRSLLRARHWELFCLWLSFCIFSGFVRHVLKTDAPEPNIAPNIRFWLSTLGSLELAVVFAWCYAVGVFLNSILPKELRLRLSVFFVASAAAFFLNIVPDSWPKGPIAIDTLVGCTCLICFGYMLRFPSKSLLAAEFQEPAKFSEYFGTLLLVMFFPIGIWFLQPRVNQLFALHHALPSSPDAIPSSPHPST